MEYVALYSCEFVCAVIPAFAVFMAYVRFGCKAQGFRAPSVVLGAVFTVYLFALLHFTGAGTMREGRSSEGPGVILPAAMIMAAFLGRFLLYDEMGLAKVLYGF